MKHLVGITLVLLFALQSACFTVIDPTDPAVHLAYCLEQTLKEHKGKVGSVEASCELGVPSDCVVVLHPDGDLTSEQLIAAGLSRNQVEVLRELRLGSSAAIYVLSENPATASSRTTYQAGFVRIPQIMVASKSSTDPLTLTLDGAPEDRFIQRIR